MPALTCSGEPGVPRPERPDNITSTRGWMQIYRTLMDFWDGELFSGNRGLYVTLGYGRT